MDPLVEAIAILKDFLEEHDIRYMVIGGWPTRCGADHEPPPTRI